MFDMNGEKRANIVVTGVVLKAEFNCKHDSHAMAAHAVKKINGLLAGWDASITMTADTEVSFSE